MSTPSSSDHPAFLQHRLALFAKWTFVVVAGSLAVRFALLPLQPEVHLDPIDTTAHALAGAVMLAMWVLLRRRSFGVGALLGIEATGLHLLSACVLVMGLGLPVQVHPELILLLGMIVTMSLRAIYVPSTERWTLGLSVSLGGWLLLNAWWTGERALALADADPRYLAPGSLVTNVAVWWFFATVVNTRAARVVHGLREQVREARQLGQYTLDEKLGEGGMGVVYRAHHAMLRRPTAVKLLPPDVAGEKAIARFEREVQRTASLSHPNIVTVFDYGRTPDGVFYYAMELLEGLDLAQLVGRFGPQPPGRVVHLLAQICDGLAEAHAVGLIHRDVKPANAFLVRQGRTADRVKLVDFGLVKELEAGRNAALTQDDTITGTPQYLSPEAIERPDEVDARSDLYAVGAVGYFLLTGTQVFEARTVVALASMHLQTAPEPPSARLDAPVPEGLEEVILRCLEKDSDRRPPSAEALRDLLRSLELEDVQPWRDEDARRWWDAHGEALAVEHEALATAPTLEVDVRRRRGGGA
ncbi:MAG TPA: serine/threonine-protein kinase [Sandaracinaceae bacterium LLY-WYZ-13_1]|nr:serine/threonine-protein kinase [Sandaracinaceae bacterium LLY-WYZ-13_1]